MSDVGVVIQDGDGTTGRTVNYPRTASAGCRGEMVQWPL